MWRHDPLPESHDKCYRELDPLAPMNRHELNAVDRGTDVGVAPVPLQEAWQHDGNRAVKVQCNCVYERLEMAETLATIFFPAIGATPVFQIAGDDAVDLVRQWQSAPTASLRVRTGCGGLAAGPSMRARRPGPRERLTTHLLGC